MKYIHAHITIAGMELTETSRGKELMAALNLVGGHVSTTTAIRVKGLIQQHGASVKIASGYCSA